MAENAGEFPKSTEELGAVPHALRPELVQDQLARDEGDAMPAETNAAAETPLPLEERSETTPPPLAEPSEATPPKLQAHEEHDTPVDTPPQSSESPTPAAELRGQEPAAALPQPSATEPAKPRSLFPALMATALAGALLGVGGSYGLRFLESSRSNSAASDVRLTELTARLDALESKEAAAPSASRSAVAGLEARVAAAEGAAHNAEELAKAAEADIQKAAGSPPATKEPSDGSLARAERPDLAPFESRLTALEQKFAQTGPEAAQPKTSVRAERDVENAPANETARAQEVAIVAENLLRKLDHGEEFSPELAALENLGISQSALAPLRAASASPVATERELTAQFANLSAKIIATEYAAPAGQEESFLDRLTRNAKGLVDIRRVGDSSATDVPSLVTKIESALADHEIEAAFKAWTELPGGAKNVALNFGEAAKSRLDAVNAAKSIEADAVAVLGKPKAAETRN
ncbi:MAG TPA: hypothetical protein VKE72_01475 [Methylocella sp.]|nr:hypothetical protein [Methylocella sp.]